MTHDAVQVVQALFSIVWRLFTEWRIPGTRTTPGAYLVFLLFAALCIKFVTSILGMGGSLGSFVNRHSKPPRGSGGSGSRRGK